MGIIAFIILGLLAGAIAKAVLPGDDPGGFIVTALIGVAGALIGGFLAGALFDADPMDEFFDISTWLTAIVGSIILLLIYRLFVGRQARRSADGGLAAAPEAPLAVPTRSAGFARRPSARVPRPPPAAAVPQPARR